MSHGRDLPPARRSAQAERMPNQPGGQTGHAIPQSARETARRPREPPARSRVHPSAPSAVQASSTDTPPHLAPTHEAAGPPPPPSGGQAPSTDTPPRRAPVHGAAGQPPPPFGGQTAAVAARAKALPVRRERTAPSTRSTPRGAIRANGPSVAACAESARPVHAAQQFSAASTDGTSRRSGRSYPCVSLPCRHRSPRVSRPKTSLEKKNPDRDGRGSPQALSNGTQAFFMASSTATATATVAPTIGLLPMPMRPIISTCAGTDEEPANCASECMRPIVSVMP